MVCHFSRNPSDLGYPDGSFFPGGIGYPSRRGIIASRNPHGACIIPAAGAIFSGMPIQAGYPTGLGFLVNFRSFSRLNLPIGFHNPQRHTGADYLGGVNYRSR